MSHSRDRAHNCNVSPASQFTSRPVLSPYQQDKMVKKRHQKKRAKGKRISIAQPGYAEETMASLLKRKSFTKSSKVFHCEMVNERAQLECPRPGLGIAHAVCECEACQAIPSTVSTDIVRTVSFPVSASDNQNRATHKLQQELQQTSVELERAHDVFAKRVNLEGNTAGGRTRECKRVLALSNPSRCLADSRLLFNGETTDEAAADGIEFRRLETIEPNLPFPGHVFSRQTTTAMTELPTGANAERVVDATNEDAAQLRKAARSSSRRKVSCDCWNPADLQPSATQSTQTAGANGAADENSNGATITGHLHRHSDAVIHCFPISWEHFRDVEENDQETHRASHANSDDDSDVKGNLILAGLFLGVGVIIGKICNSSDTFYVRI